MSLRLATLLDSLAVASDYRMHSALWMYANIVDLFSIDERLLMLMLIFEFRF